MQLVSTKTSEQRLHFFRGHALHQAGLNLITLLRLVIETQLLERRPGLRFDPCQSIANLMVGQEGRTMAVLHHMG